MHIDERLRLISLSCILQTDYKCAFTNHKKVKLNEYPHCRDTLYLTWLLKKTRANVKPGNESAYCRYVNKNNWQRICKIAFKKTKQKKKQNKTKQKKKRLFVFNPLLLRYFCNTSSLLQPTPPWTFYIKHPIPSCLLSMYCYGSPLFVDTKKLPSVFV